MRRQRGKRHPVDKALSNIRGVTAKPLILQNAMLSKSALRLPEMHASPIPLGQGEPSKCQKLLPSSAELRPANFQRRSEAFFA